MKRYISLFFALAAVAAAQVTVPWEDVSKPASIDAIDGLTPAADKFAVYSGANAAGMQTVTPFALTLLDDIDAATVRTTLGLGTGNSPVFTGITAPAATNLTLSGGSSGASLTLGQGSGGIGTLSNTGTGYFSVTNSSASQPARFVVESSSTGQAILDLKAGSGVTNRASRVDFYNLVTSTSVPRWTIINDWNQNGTNELRVTPASSATPTAVFTSTGNLLIGTTTDSSNGRIQISTHTTSSGGIGFGTDISLYRTSTALLQTNATFQSLRPTSNDTAFVATVSGDTSSRWVVYTDGKIELGAGNIPRDTNLYRSAANTLATDDSFQLGGKLTVSGSGASTFEDRVAITKAGLYTTEGTEGLSLVSAASDSKLIMGADATNDVTYIQSMQAGTSFGTRPLWINAMGGNTVIGAVATPVTITSAGNLTVPGTGTNTFASRADISRGDNTSANFAHLGLKRGTGAGTEAGIATVGDGANGVASVRVYVGATTTADFSASGVDLLGTTTNDNAATGFVGEYIASTLASASAISLTTNTSANVTSISLSAGDWDVSCSATFQFVGTTVTEYTSGVSTTSGNFGVTGTYMQEVANFVTTSGQPHKATPIVRLSLSSTTTVYMVSRAVFSAGTVTAYGTIRARRVR